MAAITLAELQKSAEDGGLVEDATVIELFRQNSDLLDALEYQDINGSAFSFDQESTLSTVASRALNEDFTANHGVVTRQTEAMKIYGGQIKVDRAGIKMNGEGSFAIQRRMKVKALSRTITDDWIKGDETAEMRDFDGLQARVPLTSSQHIANDGSSGGGAPSLAKLDEAIDIVSGATHLLMPRALRRRLIKAARTTSVTGTVNFETNELGRRVMFYNDLPILVGYEASKNDTFLPFNETPDGGGSAVTASIYVLRLGLDGVHGLQNGDMQIFPPQRVSEGTAITTDIEWILAAAIKDPFAISRLSSCTDADWVA